MSELDRRLLAALAAHQGPAGICPRMGRLAELLGCSPRHVRRRLAVPESAGLIERVAVFERDDDPEWQRRGRRPSHPRRQTSNTYRMSGGPPDMTSQEPAVQPPGHAKTMSALEGKEQADGGYQGVDEGERALLPREPVEIAIEPPEAALLDHPPDIPEILGTLGRTFGEVLVLEGPATYRTARGRLIDLAACPPKALHQAVDQLQRDTCLDGGCQPGHPCRRHQRRQRAER